MKKIILLQALLLAFFSVQAQPHTYVPEGALKKAYKTADTTTLHIWVIQPEKAYVPGRNPAVVFFFGGGWSSGSVKQFEPQARHLAERGMTVCLAEYRTMKSSGTSPYVSVADARSAMRYVRAHAGELGIDPGRIAASGGSAGGHLAAATAYVTAFDDPSDDLSVDPAPDALILFNPVIDNSDKGYGYERVRERWREFSPMHNISKENVRPTLFMVGSKDHLIPVSTVEEYAGLCRRAGGRCDLKVYEGAGHGFFNYGNKKKEKINYYEVTLREADDFLVSMGYLPDAAKGE